jgi:hypothetical protein
VLGLDADALVAEFDLRYPEPEREPLPVRPRRRRRIPRGAIAAVVAAAAIVAFVAWSSSSHPSSPSVLAPPAPAHAAPPPRRHVRLTVVKPKPPANLVIRATRGNCWLLVRIGGATGRVAYEATLQHGHSVTFGHVKLWIRFGAPANVDARRGGRPVAGLAGTGSTPVNLMA